MAESPFSGELRPEETQSGFDVSDAADAFELERLDAHPGIDLPEFAGIFTEVRRNESNPNTSNISNGLENYSAPAEAIEHSRDRGEQISREPEFATPISYESDVLSPDIIVGDAPDSAIKSDDIIDRELLEMLQADLTQARAQKTPEPQPVVAPSKPFEDIEDGFATNEFDFNDIEARHPSEYLAIPEQTSPKARDENSASFSGYSGYAEMAAETMSPFEASPKTAEARNDQQKKRRLMPYIAAAGILLIAGLGGTAYWLWHNNHQTTQLGNAADSTAKIIANKQNDQNQGNNKLSAETKPQNREHLPDAKLSAPAKEDAKSPLTATIEKKLPEHNASAAPKTIENHNNKPTATTELPPKTELKEKNITAAKREEPKVTNVGSSAPRDQTQHLKISAQKIEPSDKISQRQKFKSEKVSAPGSESGVYTVQIYSTPSREDAEEWLDRLRAKQIADGFVSNQIVRGQTWYRVRFGSFASRDEAESAARNNGFSKSWVDRIK